MKTVLDFGVVCVTVLMMGAVGMELEGRHFRDVARRKGTLILILTAQALFLPALGFGLTRVMALPPHISAGILLLAACPVATSRISMRCWPGPTWPSPSRRTPSRSWSL